MRACIQRVSEAQVTVDGDVIGRIGRGLVVLLGVGVNDGEVQVDWLAEKIVGLRIFEDDVGKMNRSLAEVGGAMLVVSQFTLYGDARKGRRPSFTDAAPPELAERLYEAFAARVRGQGIELATGRFRAHMLVRLVNDGPVTLWIDTEDEQGRKVEGGEGRANEDA
ncbi:MAG TPA: D-aminoacyl-tRNA deacylase [Lacipirellulaceae bacterium]|jgi:D-tyrosyl-tRNA(Tyr) deacylase